MSMPAQSNCSTQWPIFQARQALDWLQTIDRQNNFRITTQFRQENYMLGINPGDEILALSDIISLALTCLMARH